MYKVYPPLDRSFKTCVPKHNKHDSYTFGICNRIIPHKYVCIIYTCYRHIFSSHHLLHYPSTLGGRATSELFFLCPPRIGVMAPNRTISANLSSQWQRLSSFMYLVCSIFSLTRKTPYTIQRTYAVLHAVMCVA